MNESRKPAKRVKRKPPYSLRGKHDRNKVIYGVCVDPTGRRHYCFNREYAVLPIELPYVALEAIKQASEYILDQGINCFGTNRPKEYGDLLSWKTYYVFWGDYTPHWIYPK